MQPDTAATKPQYYPTFESLSKPAEEQRCLIGVSLNGCSCSTADIPIINLICFLRPILALPHIVDEAE
jgi:hypothetical protein